MAARRTPFSYAIKSAEVMGAVPVVVGHRLARMAAVRLPLEDRDRKEFVGMSVEKALAFNQAWQALWAGMFGVQMAFTAAFLRGKVFSMRPQNAQMRLLERTLDPVHRKVTSNARRLSKTKLRGHK